MRLHAFLRAAGSTMAAHWLLLWPWGQHGRLLLLLLRLLLRLLLLLMLLLLLLLLLLLRLLLLLLKLLGLLEQQPEQLLLGLRLCVCY